MAYSSIQAVGMKPHKQDDERKKRWTLHDFFMAACAFAIVFIVAAIFLPGLLNIKRIPEEIRAKAVLRLLGEAELAYRAANKARAWGSWDDLVEAGYMNENYTLDNIIDEYTLWLSVDNPSLSAGKRSAIWGGLFNTFTIVAFPRKTAPPGYMSTFAISEDLVLRVYRPETPGAKAWGEDDDFGARTWEPIR
jgi:type II secretory pathway pseudopilin PulG